METEHGRNVIQRQIDARPSSWLPGARREIDQLARGQSPFSKARHVGAAHNTKMGTDPGPDGHGDGVGRGGDGGVEPSAFSRQA
jgi:hypothetical protein